MKGYIQVYTGNGKGKTTAALGLALRAAGAGKKVFFAQFIKGMEYSELNSIKRLAPEITLKQYGRRCFIFEKPEPEDLAAAEKGIQEVRDMIQSKQYDIIVMDEINIALHMKLIELKDLLDLLEEKPPETELVLTGRYAPPALLERADLVTEMREIKHYYEKGVPARTGIEK